jgi:hypothetical protein
MPRRHRTVVELHETLVDAPLHDGASAWRSRLGLFHSVRDASHWLHRRIASEPADDPDVGLLYFTLAVLPIAPHPAPVREIVFDGAGRVHAEIDGDWDAPFSGVPRDRCRFHERDLVGFVVNGA